MLRYLALCAALAACTDEPELLDDTEQLGELSCPGITSSGVTTYRGLTGAYQRLGLPAVDEPYRLRFIAERDDTDAAGTFTGTQTTQSGLLAAYAGRFRALPDNPAIGAALALDVGSDGEFNHLYFVLGVQRSFGRVRSLCLLGADGPFMMTRTLY